MAETPPQVEKNETPTWIQALQKRNGLPIESAGSTIMSIIREAQVMNNTKLPNELWMKIFALATWVPDQLAPLASETLLEDELQSHSTEADIALNEYTHNLKRSYQTKHSLILVCKSWCKLAERHLYSAFEGFDDYSTERTDLFVLQCYKDTRLGSYTKWLGLWHIYFDNWDHIDTLFPNLTTLLCSVPGERKLTCPSKLKHLHLVRTGGRGGGLGTFAVFQNVAHFVPHLEYLRVSFAENLPEPVTLQLQNLQVLHIECETDPEELCQRLANIIVPNLHTLLFHTLYPYAELPIFDFIEKHRETLTRLSLDGGMGLTKPSSPLILPRLSHLCLRLHWNYLFVVDYISQSILSFDSLTKLSFQILLTPLDMMRMYIPDDSFPFPLCDRSLTPKLSVVRAGFDGGGRDDPGVISWLFTWRAHCRKAGIEWEDLKESIEWGPIEEFVAEHGIVL